MQSTDVKLILAPMAGFSDQPFRRLARRFGADEVVTELISANALVRENQKTFEMAAIHPDERPASIQIFGAEPAVMAEAARRVEPLQPLFIDINMGCPAKKVTRNGAGAALLDDPRHAAAVIEAVVKAVKIPVSVKLRTGRNSASKTGLEVARRAADVGIARITLHARTVADAFHGPIDYEAAATLRAGLPASVELIGNGDIHGAADARRWLERTGVNGLMIGRGAVGHPSVFAAVKNGVEPPAAEEAATVLLHIDWMEEFYGLQRALGPLRGHMMYYCKGLAAAKQFRKEAMHVPTVAALRELVAGYFGKTKAQCAA